MVPSSHKEQEMDDDDDRGDANLRELA